MRTKQSKNKQASTHKNQYPMQLAFHQEQSITHTKTEQL